jgi:hypothetical protein
METASPACSDALDTASPPLSTYRSPICDRLSQFTQPGLPFGHGAADTLSRALNARIDDAIEQINEEGDKHIDRRDDEYRTLHKREIAPTDRLD